MLNAKFIGEYRKNPYYNMAMDEYIFERVLTGDEDFCLRLYSWEPGGITFGLNQTLKRAFDHAQLGETAAIRRVTGGRAIYHDPDEMTYCVAVNLDAFGVHESVSPQQMFNRVAEALVIWLKKIGIDAEFARQSAAAERAPVKNQSISCFSSHARYEILGNDRKIIASAQRVMGRTIMQHGSIKWHTLVEHPALPEAAAEIYQKGELQQLTAQFQDLAAVKLRSVFSEQFELYFDYLVLDEEAKEAVERRAKKIMHDPFGRRELIAH